MNTTISPRRVIEVINRLLGPDGCPWDREQTPESLCDYLVEEVFEFVEAVRQQDVQEIKEEMGDAFFLIFFLAVLLERQGQGIELQQVWEDNARKMIRRHPHVFGQEEFGSRQDLHQKWEQIKQEEKSEKGLTRDADNSLISIPDSLPPLIKAYRIHSKASKAGFTWETDHGQEQALEKEWQEWLEARNGSRMEKKEEEFGDLLFSLVEQGRRQGIKANSALSRANRKFLSRYAQAVQLARDKDRDWHSLDMEEKDRLWDEVKKREEELK